MQAYNNRVIVENIERGETRSNFGIYLGNDDGTLSGIKPRWAKVHSVGAGINEIEVGYWILVQHGRWTRGVEVDGTVLYMVDYPTGVIAISTSTEKPDVSFTPQAEKIKAHQYRPEEFGNVERDVNGICY